MKIVVLGSSGQLGRALQATAPNQYQLIPFSKQELDITQQRLLLEKIKQLQPQVIINAAAYTEVDKAETQQELAYAVNVDGVENLAQAAKSTQAKLIHISTDFVFDGKKSTPYLPTDKPNPLNYYGITKWQGEEKIQAIIPEQALIIRTGWVYSKYNKNFVTTILKLLSERDQLGVIADQVGTPTWVKTLAQIIWQAVARKDLLGIYHCTDAGMASWYDFAVAIQEEAWQLKLLSRAVNVQPITTRDYPLPACRPAYSVLDKFQTWQDFEVTATHWRVALRNMLTEVAHA